jgi:hypothetical protein
MASLSSKPSGSDSLHGLLHRPNAYVWGSILLFRHRTRPAKDPALQCDTQIEDSFVCGVRIWRNTRFRVIDGPPVKPESLLSRRLRALSRICTPAVFTHPMSALAPCHLLLPTGTQGGYTVEIVRHNREQEFQSIMLPSPRSCRKPRIRTVELSGNSNEKGVRYLWRSE